MRTLLAHLANLDLGGPRYHDLSDVVECLLHRAELVVFGRTCRLVELEFYLYSDSHPDPFTHRHAVQQSFGQWYFHRSGEGFKNGSFKGLDVTLGSGQSYGGLLIRSMSTPEGLVLNGPCVCVNYMLTVGRLTQPRELHEMVSSRKAWDLKSDLFLKLGPESRETVYTSPRVGLSLKRVQLKERPFDFILADYRFLTNPQDVRKGRPHLIVSLLNKGYSVEQIAQITRSPAKTIRKYAEWISQGRLLRHQDFHGDMLRTEQLCKLEGALREHAAGRPETQRR